MDDGIKFQWGERWIDSDDVVKEGGKYWRDNGDGTITEFLPPALQFKCIKSNIINILGIEDFNYNNDDFTVEFKNENDALVATNEFNSLFWTRHKVSAERFGKKIQLHIIEKVLETTYTPATSN
jgi:hypothetical protein